MSINNTSAKRPSLAKRAATAALLSGSMALAGLGMTAGTAQAQPSAPVPQTWGYQYCSWAWWDWEHCHYYWDWHKWDWDHHEGGIVNTCGSACFRRPPFQLIRSVPSPPTG